MILSDHPGTTHLHTTSLMDAAQRIFERNLAIYRDSEIKTRRSREQAARSRLLNRLHGFRRITRLRRLLIIARIAEGRLPDNSSPIVSGMPGRGGKCDACDGHMPVTRVMMVIPNGEDTLAYLHAECYVLWRAQVHLRAALRRLRN